MPILLYCQIEAQNPNHWAYRNWRAWFLEAGWTVIDFDYEIETIRLGADGMRDLLRKVVLAESPDLLWHSLYQEEFPPEFVASLQERVPRMPWLGFASDDAFRLPHSLHWGRAHTLILTTEPGAQVAYREMEIPTRLCPWAAHPPSYILPVVNAVARDGVLFIGQRLSYREAMLEALAQQGGPVVAVYGVGWGTGIPTWVEMLDLYARAAVVLGINACGDGSGRPQVKARHVEVAMLGQPHLVNADPGLDIVFPGLCPWRYTSVESCVAQLHGRGTLLDEGVSDAQAVALREHTWTRRLVPILQDLGLGPEGRTLEGAPRWSP